MTAMSRLFHSARRQGVQMMRLPIVASKDHQSDHHHALEPQAVCKLELKLGQDCLWLRTICIHDCSPVSQHVQLQTRHRFTKAGQQINLV